MNAQWIARIIAVSLIATGAIVQAAPTSLSWVIGLGMTGQVASNGQAQQQSDRLLKAARQSLNAGDFGRAEQLLVEAEKLNVDYGLFHFGETPRKVRRDLERARGGSASASTTTSSRKQSGAMSHDPFQAASDSASTAKPTRSTLPKSSSEGQSFQFGAPQTSATAATSATPAGAATQAQLQGQSDTRYPDTSDRYPVANSSRSYPATAGTPSADTAAQRLSTTGSSATADGSAAGSMEIPNSGDLPSPSAAAAAAKQGDRQASDTALVESRRALALGDVSRARQHLEKARSYRITYAFHEDSPTKVEADIAKYEDVAGRRNEVSNTIAWRRQYAQVLVEQAEALLKHGDGENAERLASDAAQLGVEFGPYETSPAMLLEKITSGRPQQPRRLAVEQPDSQPIGGTDQAARKARAIALAQQSRAALEEGELERAENLLRQALALDVPDSAFGPNELRPWLVQLDVQRARMQAEGMMTAGAEMPIAGDQGTVQGLYTPETDTTQNTLTQAQGEPAALEPIAEGELEAPISPAMSLMLKGEQALKKQNKQQALEYFREAYANRDQLDPGAQGRLQDHLHMLSAGPVDPKPATPNLIDSAASSQQYLARQVAAEVAKKQSEARRVSETDPKKAIEILESARELVDGAALDAPVREQMTRRLELSLTDMQQEYERRRPEIEREERNDQILTEIRDQKFAKLEVQNKIAELVEEFNTLVDQHRFAEAEVVAKRARELAPNEPVVAQLWQTARFLRREMLNQQLREEKEGAVWAAWHSTEEASTPFDDSRPYRLPDAVEWDALSKRRGEKYGNRSSHLSEKELEIQRKLKTPVSLRFNQRPLSDVIDDLAQLTGVNIHLDPRGLHEEAVRTDQPITINLTNEVSLRSALNLILEPLHLDYVIKDEVLKITSEQLRDGEVFTETYNVADLVIPIPNFVPGSHLGLQGSLQEAYAGMGVGTPGQGAPLAVLASKEGNQGSGMINPNVLAQAGIPSPSYSPSQPAGFGPGGMGGGAEPDFDALIELITATIQPNTWDEVGGPGSVKEFPTNLSLVISQTQDVHEEIVDLLEQLRRLQDLQVTIEVRFIRLNDNFFERIGVDFDFNIADGDPRSAAAIANQIATSPFDALHPSTTVGLNPGNEALPMGTPQFQADLDIPFRQNSFTLATPGIGGFDAAAGLTFGFAILSDIEAYFLVNAAQGDARSNILQAPKVTLFNGQQAFVSDTVQMPFVISVIPVVGDFAAAQQPVIVVLNEGTFMTIQAVVSEDRRYVRLTVVPFFSQVTGVREFTFDGTTSTSTSTSRGLDDDDEVVNESSDNDIIRSGTTVQLPEFAFVTVTTTVSVPDGGTVLLGGIKRLSEQRNEFGTPLLSKVPYLDRLFRNVGIGKTTESLMMMVTPRIIIQEEEEERLGLPAP